MSSFMPINQDRHDALVEKISKTMFRTVPDFIEFYNSGLINRKNPEVIALVSEIDATYRDVKDRGGRLVVTTSEEVYLDHLSAELITWSIIVKAKRELADLVDDGVLSEDTLIAFTPDARGWVCVFVPGSEEGEEYLDKVGREKLFSRTEDIARVYGKFSTARSEDLESNEIQRFRVSDFLDKDTAFIGNMLQLIPR